MQLESMQQVIEVKTNTWGTIIANVVFQFLCDYKLGMICSLFEAKTRQDVLDMIKEHDVNQTDEDNNTALHMAANPEVAQALLENGANANFRNFQHQTPLHVCKDRAIAQVLIAGGANPRTLDKESRTPLHIAQTVEMANFLAEHFPQLLLIKDDRGRLPHEAHADKQIVQAILNHRRKKPDHSPSKCLIM